MDKKEIESPKTNGELSHLDQRIYGAAVCPNCSFCVEGFLGDPQCGTSSSRIGTKQVPPLRSLRSATVGMTIFWWDECTDKLHSQKQMPRWIAAFLVLRRKRGLVTPTAVSAATEAAASSVSSPIWTAIASFRGALCRSGSGKRGIPVEIGFIVWKIAAALDG
jgi:hypothetical protein